MIVDTAHDGFFLAGQPDTAHDGFFLSLSPDTALEGFFLVVDGAVVGSNPIGFFDQGSITQDYQFDIDGRPFGRGLPVCVLADGFQPGDPDVRSQDTDNPAGGGRLFGTTTLGGATWLFNGFVNDSASDQAMLDLESFASAWRRGYRPGEISVLRYQLGGRIRRVYGQSRRISQTFDNRLMGGFVGVSFTFATADAYTYADEEGIVLMPFVPPTTGGLKSPLKAPLSTSAGGVGHGVIDTGGREDAPFTATIYGPLSRGYLYGRGWKIVLAKPLLAGDVLTVDTTPWSRGVRLNGVPTTGLLAPTSSRLSDARLPAAGDRLEFGGVDPTGTAAVEVRWRPTYSSV